MTIVQRCFVCNEDLPLGQRHCETCGVPAGRSCDRCGFTNVFGSNYCGSCAASLIALPEPELRQLTVVFCDLVSSSALSEQLAPEELRELLRVYQRTCASVFREAGGHVAQYLGDGIVAYYGFPIAREGAEIQAVNAALAAVEAVTSLTEQDAGSLKRPLGVRVGVHTGPALVHELPRESQTEQIAIGATPNIAARIQAEAGPNQVFVTSATEQHLRDAFELDPLGPRTLKGISQPHHVFRVVGKRAGQRSWVRRPAHSRTLIGRAQPLDELLQRWNALAASRQSTAVVVRGEPGIGKSRLIRELEARALEAQPAATSVSCACSAYHTAHAFYPLKQFIVTHAGLRPEDDDATKRAKLSAILPASSDEKYLAALIALTGGPVALPADVFARRQLVFEALSEIFVELTRAAPLLLIVEDLHWSDASTLACLERWIARPVTQGNPTYLVASMRHEGAAVPASWHTIDLQPLAAEHSEALVEQWLDATQLPHKLQQQVVQLAGGNPLYLEEFSRALQEGAGTDSRSIPASLRDCLTERLDQLGDSRNLARLMSCVGRESRPEWLCAITELSEPELRRHLAKLTEHELIERATGPDESYRFRHALLQNAAYESLPSTTRKEYHRRIALTLAGQFPDVTQRDPVLIAHHYEVADARPQAAAQLSRAAQQAMLASAFTETIALCERALRLVRELEETPEVNALEVGLRSMHGLSLCLVHGYSAMSVQQTFHRARELCERAGSVPLPILYGVFSYHLVRAEGAALDSIMPLLAAAMTEAEAPGHSAHDRDAARLIGGAAFGVLAYFRAEYDAARRYFSAATPVIRLEAIAAQHELLMFSYGFDNVLTPMLWLCWIDALEGEISRARSGLADLLQVARNSGHAYLHAQACAFGATLARELDDVEWAAALASETLEVAGRNGFFFWAAFGSSALGWVQLRRGEAEQGLANIRAALRVLQDIGSLANLAYFESYLVEAQLALADHTAGLAAVDVALCHAREGVGYNYQPELLRLKGMLLAQLGRVDAAIDHCQAALFLARTQGARLLSLRAGHSLAELLVLHSRHDEARRTLSTTLAMFSNESARPVASARMFLDALKDHSQP